MNDWLASADNHASADYDRDRRGRTWREEHPPSERAQRKADRRHRQRVRNRAADRFGTVNWDAYQHEQLYDMIMRADPATMYARAGEWSALAGRIEATTGRVKQIVDGLMASWQGQAAVDAAAANTRLMHWAGTASHTAGRIAEGLATYTEAVETARRRMPDPAFATAERNFRDGYTVSTTGGPSDAILLRELLTDGLVSHERARARKAEAVAVMSAYESSARQVHDGLPTFADAHSGVEPGDTWTAPPATPEAAAPPAAGSSPGHGAVPTPGQGTVRPEAGAVPPAQTAAAGFVDPSSAGGPGSLNGPVGSAAGADGVRGSAGGGPGAGVPPGSAARGVPGALGVSPARGVPGPGAIGGLPMAPGAGREEDVEHTNKYDNGLDLLDDLPPAYPPVFGA